MVRGPCPALWKTPVISSDGKLTICCADVNLDVCVADLNREDFYEAWTSGEKINYYRLLHLLGEHERIPICRNCKNLNWRKITVDEIKEYLNGLDNVLLGRLLMQISEDRLNTGKAASFIHKPWLQDNWWLTLEISGKCNLSCPDCSQRVYDVRGEHMDFDLFRKIIGDIRKDKLKFNSITPFFRGESLFHPKFREIIQYLADNRNLFGFYTFHTNACYLAKGTADVLLDAYSHMQYGELYFSIDAASEEIYQKVRPGGDYNETINNIKYFILQKKKRGIKYPLMIFQFVVRDENLKDAQKFYDHWSSFLKENSIDFTINSDYSRIINVHKIHRNLIYFRRLETKPENQEKNLELQRKVYEAIRCKT
ncbi:MAG: radical SAM protein [archaeon]